MNSAENIQEVPGHLHEVQHREHVQGQDYRAVAGEDYCEYEHSVCAGLIMRLIKLLIEPPDQKGVE